MKKIYIRKDYCLGCGLCEIYCATFHSRYPDSIVKAYKLSASKPVSRLVVEKMGDDACSVMCRHCREPMCLYSCIAGAVYRTGEGAVVVDEDRCVGCGTCVLACPYGLIKKEKVKEGGKFLALKCDLCGGKSELPQCVANCPNEALVWREEEEACAM